MKLTVARPIPMGSYDALLTSADETMHPEYGSGLECRFRFTSGAAAGQEMRVTLSLDSPPRPTNKLGRFLSGFLGRPLVPGEDVDVSALVGRTYTAVVAANAKGDGTTITAVLPAQEKAPFADTNEASRDWQ